MGFFGNLFKSKEKQIHAQKYKVGMKKTRESVFNNLKNLLNSSELISDDLFDELEEIFIMADIGVDTVVKFVNHLRSTVDIKDINTPEKLYDLIVEEMYKLYVQDEIMISNLEVQNDRLNIVLFVGVNGVGKTTTIGKVANEYIKKGKNTLRMQVIRWCDGSYLEDQDGWRMSGIFRDIFLVQKNEVHLRDYFVTSPLTENGAEFKLQLDLSTRKAQNLKDYHIEISLKDSDGTQKINQTINAERTINFKKQIKKVI